MGQKTKQKSMLSTSPFPPVPAMKNWHTKGQKNPTQTISKTTVNDGQVDREHL